MPSTMKKNQVVFLRSEFRNSLFSRAYEAEGSLHSIALAMGYLSGDGLNGSIREMWKGTRGVPLHRLESLAKIAKTSSDEVLRNVVSKNESQIINDWFYGLTEYRRLKRAGKARGSVPDK